MNTATLLLLAALAHGGAVPPTVTCQDDHGQTFPAILTKLAIASAGATAMIDLAITEYHLGANTLREANPLLRRWERSPAKMGLAKASLTAAQMWVLLKLKDRHRAWTFVTAAIIAGFNGWAIRHNLHEARK